MKAARIWLAIAALALAAAPARAAETGEGASAPTIQMESVALPVIVNGALLNYVFVSIRLELFPHTDGSAVRLKEQFFRDDLVRSGHRTPFTRFDDYTKIDEAKVKAEVLRAAPGIVGPNVIKNAVITQAGVAEDADPAQGRAAEEGDLYRTLIPQVPKVAHGCTLSLVASRSPQGRSPAAQPRNIGKSIGRDRGTLHGSFVGYRRRHYSRCFMAWCRREP